MKPLLAPTRHLHLVDVVIPGSFRIAVPKFQAKAHVGSSQFIPSCQNLELSRVPPTCVAAWRLLPSQEPWMGVGNRVTYQEYTNIDLAKISNEYSQSINRLAMPEGSFFHPRPASCFRGSVKGLSLCLRHICQNNLNRREQFPVCGRAVEKTNNIWRLMGQGVPERVEPIVCSEPSPVCAACSLLARKPFAGREKTRNPIG